MERLFGLLAIVLTVPASACMGVGDGPVRFSGQTNIVVWDAAHATEHFVRDARFQAEGKSLGFIAPSPGRPDIEAVDSMAFTRLAALDPTRNEDGSFGMGGMGGGSMGGGGVRVVETKIVAGYEATVLKADDSRALAQWMDDHGYPMPAYAARWMAPYVRAGWYLTAFKVAAGDGQGSTGPVRMSFKTRTPFNPYSVPAENTGRGGLALYYVSTGNEEPTMGRVSPWLRPRWQALLDPKTRASLSEDLKLTGESIPQGSQVRFYQDPSFGRPGFSDLYFVPVPRPVGRISERSAALASLGVFAFVRSGRRRKASSTLV